MRLWLLGRPDAGKRRGGDQLQLEECAALAAAHSIDVVLTGDASTIRPRPGDCVHLFNLQRCPDWGDLPERTKEAGARLLITPLFHSTETYHREGRRGPSRVVSWLVPDADRFDGLRWGGKSPRRRAGEILPLVDGVLLAHVDEEVLIRDWLGDALSPLAPEPSWRVIPVAIPRRKSSDVAGVELEIPWRDFVLCAGRVEPLKNTTLVAQVCQDLDLPLVLAGGDPGIRHRGYRQRAAKGALWFGELAPEQVRWLMGQARVHVLASWAEVVGRVSLEAALGGTSVVCSDVGFGPDYLGRHNDGVFVFKPGSRQGLSEALMQAWKRGRVTDSPLVEHVRQNYTWAAVGPDLIEEWRS